VSRGDGPAFRTPTGSGAQVVTTDSAKAKVAASKPDDSTPRPNDQNRHDAREKTNGPSRCLKIRVTIEEKTAAVHEYNELTLTVLVIANEPGLRWRPPLSIFEYQRTGIIFCQFR